MNLFYTPDISDDSYTLSEDESRHCIRVLRLKKSDTIHLIDGKGGFYTAEITDDKPKKCLVKIVEAKKEYGKRDVYLHLAVAPTKNTERFEWFLEKATEIGINEITPIDCRHSERSVVKTERLTKVIVAAMKQSLKAYLPKLNETIPYADFIKKQFEGRKFIAHCNHLSTSRFSVPHLKEIYSKNHNALILIGPEGDFSKEEVEAAMKNNFQEISLGSSRLRTETAAVVACSTIGIINE